jgi:hypothetical protein
LAATIFSSPLLLFRQAKITSWVLALSGSASRPMTAIERISLRNI